MVRNASSSFTLFEKTLNFLGVSKYFHEENTVIAGSVGCQKPDIRIFQTVIDKCQMNEIQQKSPDKILMVGNEMDSDILGARMMGWKSILMLTTEETSGGLADWEFHSLFQIKDQIFSAKGLG